MDYHRWSALFRGYDVGLRYNQLILALTAVGGGLGFAAALPDAAAAALQGVVGAAAVFLAGALAKELAPDHPHSAVIAAALTLPFAWHAGSLSLLVPFWLLGCLRFLNRATGLLPKWTDAAVLLAAAGWLSWQLTPLFGILMGLMLLVDALMPEGARANGLAGIAIIAACGVWLVGQAWRSTNPDLWLMALLMANTLGFMTIILRSYRVDAVGDATGRPLNPLRVQAGQSFGLSAGLLLASWQGEAGVLLLAPLWTALAGILAYGLLFARGGRSVAVF